MNNNYIEKEFKFNKELKEKFLNYLENHLENKNYKPVIENYLLKLSKIEQELNKNIYEFYIEEIEQLFIRLNPATDTAASQYLKYSNLYVQFAIDQGEWMGINRFKNDGLYHSK